MKLKEAWHTFRELWKIKRFRSFLKLGLYFIFITFVVTLIRVSSSNTPVVPETLAYKDYHNYDFVYEIGDTRIIGTTYDNEAIMYIDGKSYTYINEELIYNGEVVDQTFNNIVLSLLLPKNLDNLINMATYDSSVTYTDSKKETYLLSGESYSNYMKMEVISEDDIVLTLVKEDELITEIAFNDIKLTYSNIGKIAGLNK